MPNVVIVDDDAGMRSAVVWALRKDGHTVLAYEDAAPAIDQVDFKDVDLIITDLNMPLLGEQFILFLRERGITAPVLVISVCPTLDRTRYFNDLGVHQVLEKPFPLSTLLNLVRELVPS